MNIYLIIAYKVKSLALIQLKLKSETISTHFTLSIVSSNTSDAISASCDTNPRKAPVGSNPLLFITETTSVVSLDGHTSKY